VTTGQLLDWRDLFSPPVNSGAGGNMFDVDRLVELGLFSQMIPIWQVFFYVAVMVPFLLLDRVRLCLLITYLFTFYLGFMVQWGDYLAANESLLPFFLYAFSGIFVTVVFVILVFRDESPQIKFRLTRSTAILHPFKPGDDA
jgi:hypothetical protein